jgi:triosephosphate isomerase (TIM)
MSSNIESFIEQIVRKIVSEKLENSVSQTSSARSIVVANWKMNMTIDTITTFVQELTYENAGVESVICPPFPYLYPLKSLLNDRNIPFSLGGQNAHSEALGAHTGEVSAEQLVDVGCKYVILGHSERREAGETHEIITKKVSRTLKAGLIPVICVGETEAERNDLRTNCVIKKQLLSAIEVIDNPTNIIIAYEPVWAIGTGKSATPLQAQEIHEYIRGLLGEKFGVRSLEVPILYGGSVKPENVNELSMMKDINGALVGGASLNAKDFHAIITGFSKEAIK